MAELISVRLPNFAPDTNLYRLADGRHVLVTVPGVISLPAALSFGVEAEPTPTEIYLSDEDGVPIDADDNPCNGLTALARYPAGTTHAEALDYLEAVSRP